MGDFPWSPEGRWYWARRHQKLFWFSVDSARLTLVWSFGIQKGLRVERRHVSSMISFHPYLGCPTARIQRWWRDVACPVHLFMPCEGVGALHGCHRMIFWQPLITGAALFQGVSLAFGGPLCTNVWEKKSCMCPVLSARMAFQRGDCILMFNMFKHAILRHCEGFEVNEACSCPNQSWNSHNDLRRLFC